jgi:hypothetical protein
VTRIGYLSVGDGPSVLVIPGILSMAATHHQATGTRRERPQGEDYSIVKECEDVLAGNGDYFLKSQGVTS